MLVCPILIISSLMCVNLCNGNAIATEVLLTFLEAASAQVVTYNVKLSLHDSYLSFKKGLMRGLIEYKRFFFEGA